MGRRSSRWWRHSGAAADPLLAALVELLLPERDALLELVDEVTARGAVPPAQCPGTADNPAAQPGNFFPFESATSNSAALAVYDAAVPVAGITDQEGATVRILSTADNTVYYSIGTWAATSGPTAAPVVEPEGDGFRGD
jgi:hypothetical protein